MGNIPGVLMALLLAGAFAVVAVWAGTKVASHAGTVRRSF